MYKINLQSHQLTILQTDPKLDALKFSTHYETNNYYITSIDPFQIINKSAMTYKYSDLTHLVKLLAVNPQSFVLIRGDSITVSINATEKN
ncbi:MAG: hypothetical protein IPG95_05420 [Saprospiraceae bacterium]|nr:hypothetical protein [Saprospiraceae bacterium]